MIHIYKETPCVAILNKNVIFFIYKIGEQEGRVEQVLPGHGWYQWEGGRDGERVWEDKYSANTMYTCM
jgi:hypothetical protein